MAIPRNDISPFGLAKVVDTIENLIDNHVRGTLNTAGTIEVTDEDLGGFVSIKEDELSLLNGELMVRYRNAQWLNPKFVIDIQLNDKAPLRLRVSFILN